MATWETGSARFANFKPGVAFDGGSRSFEKLLDALIENQTFDAHQRRKNQRLVYPTGVGDCTHDADDVPQHAEVTEGGGECEQQNRRLEIAGGFKKLIETTFEFGEA